MVSLETYKEFLLPYDKILAEKFQPFGIHHCGKTMEHVVEGYAEVLKEMPVAGSYLAGVNRRPFKVTVCRDKKLWYTFISCRRSETYLSFAPGKPIIYYVA